LMKMQLDDNVLGVLVRLSDERVDLQPWVESVGTVLSNKPPKHWIDKDEGVFETSLLQFERRFRQLEALSLELANSEEDRNAYCLSILVPGKRPQEQVLRMKDSQQADVQRLKRDILGRLAASGGTFPKEVILLALTEAALQVIEQEPTKPVQMDLI
jgi:hypothetical protein